MPIQRRDRVHLPGEQESVSVIAVDSSDPTEVVIVFERRDGRRSSVVLSDSDFRSLQPIRQTGLGEPRWALASLWSFWMFRTLTEIRAAALASTPLQPYPHQHDAVYESMLPRPILRFLLGDEPGTGKTVMAGLYIREMQRAGRLGKVLLVVPAHLVPKWQRDLHRFFGIDADTITSELVRGPGPLRPDRDYWIVSVDLLARNPQVKQKAVFDSSSAWDLVVVDEAHRLTPTAQSAFPVALHLAERCTHFLLLTATPHRGNEYLFRALLHLLDPKLYPWSPEDERRLSTSGYHLRPAPMHFLRRMKEHLYDHDRKTLLFTPRKAHNLRVSLGAVEQGLYDAALSYCEKYFDDPTGLVTSIYGKRGASSLHALSLTLTRRLNRLQNRLLPTMSVDVIPPHTVQQYEEEDEQERMSIEDLVNQLPSRDPKQELKDLNELLSRIRATLSDSAFVPEKLVTLATTVLKRHGISPGCSEQLLIFTEFTDTAYWLAQILKEAGYLVECYTGQANAEERDRIQQEFLAHKFQILVSTDAGNEGIDLQSAHVQVNWDIPWSLGRLEQRMGRLHRIGQSNPVDIYNLIAVSTREGRVQDVVLDRIVAAANALDGKLFDSLGSVLDQLQVDYPGMCLRAMRGEIESESVRQEAACLKSEELAANWHAQREAQIALTTTPNLHTLGGHMAEDDLQAINPAIIGAYIRVCSKARGWSMSEIHKDVLRIDSDAQLPEYLGKRRQAILALSGDALRRARNQGAVLRSAIVVGPAEPSFRTWVEDIAKVAADALFAGTVLEDSSALTDYDLFAFDSTIIVRRGSQTSRERYPLLIRCDETGARAVDWSIIANLKPTERPVKVQSVSGPARQAEGTASAVLMDKQRELQTKAQQRVDEDLYQLDALETRLLDSLHGLTEEQRRVRADQIRSAVRERRVGLMALEDVQVEGPVLAGQVSVLSRLTISTESAQTNLAIEEVALRFCIGHLQRDFLVADVHQEGKGYDLEVRSRSNPADIRCIEVKGKSRDLSDGIYLEPSEWLQAVQRGDSYWVYVVTNCQDVPELFGCFRNPALLFSSKAKRVERFFISASALREAALR